MRRQRTKARAAGRGLVERLERRRLLSSIYVDASMAGGAHDGSSWTNAYQDLQAALTRARSGDRVLVAAGTYKPTSGTDRTATFQLKNGVKIEGGYAGDLDPANPNARGIALYATILSGDIGAPGTNADNSHHVVSASNVDGAGMLDGFTVTAGNASGTANGGGLYVEYGAPKFLDCTFVNNVADLRGGGTYIQTASAKFYSCTFESNTAADAGGAAYLDAYGDAVVPDFFDCVFRANTATDGGALRSGGDSGRNAYTYTMVAGCTFVGNAAANGGGDLQ